MGQKVIAQDKRFNRPNSVLTGPLLSDYAIASIPLVFFALGLLLLFRIIKPKNSQDTKYQSGRIVIRTFFKRYY